MPHSISTGGVSISIWQGKDSRWYWHYYESGKRKLASSRDLTTAKARAKAHLQSLTGTTSTSTTATGISHADLSEFRLWQSTRARSRSTIEVFQDYLTSLQSAHRSEIYIRKIRQELANFAAEHGQVKISEIQADQIDTYLLGLQVGPRRQNNIRATLISAWQFARSREWLPEGRTAPEKVPRRNLPRHPISVFTPAQVRHILRRAEAPWRPALAIGAFAGVRTAEIGRLYWRNIMLAKRLIEIPAKASKTGRRRLVPILPNLELWLAGQHDPEEMICPYEGHQVFLERLLRQNPDIRWIVNGLRHSFGSYRCAILKDIAAVAFEMGNSPQMVQGHYHEAQELDVALEYFAIVPEAQNPAKTASG